MFLAPVRDRTATLSAQRTGTSNPLSETLNRITDSINSSPTGFDPSPHIRTLESALAQLLPLRKANAQKTSELERSVAVAERAYRSDVRGAKAGFEVRVRATSCGG
jgi:hypothetical protein